MSLSEISMENLHFSNLTIDRESYLLEFLDLKVIEIKSAVLENVKVIDSQDDLSNILKIQTLNLNSDKDSFISGISIKNTTISLFKIDSVINSAGSPREFNIENISISDSNFEGSRSIITTKGIQTSDDFTMSISQLNINKISFPYNGHILEFDHLLQYPIVISDSNFNNLNHTNIVFNSVSSSNSEIKNSVEFRN